MTKAPTPASELYETDFQTWTQKQVSLLQQRQWHQLDVPHLIEEIESLGVSNSSVKSV